MSNGSIPVEYQSIYFKIEQYCASQEHCPFDVKRKLHLFTKSNKSKCYHVAGYFMIDQNGQKQVIFCPKYIFIQRYDYQGPFKTESEANSLLNT
jgi:hypothetical protein